MSESKHTPGSWSVRQDPEDGSWEVIRVTNEQGHYTLLAYALTETVARLIAAAPDMLAAAQLLETAELNRQNCDDCEGEGEPEACGTCFPHFDDARVKRRLAIAKATGATP